MIDEKTKKWLASFFGPDVRFDEPMSHHTSFRIGGPAAAVVAPKRPSDVATLLKRAFDEKIPWLVVGGGTNLLVGDDGIDGMVIFIGKGFDRIAQKTSPDGRPTLTAMAGASLPGLCSFAAKNGLSGMNFAVGIPGTVGGAVMMNASSSRGSMDEVMERIQIIGADGERRTLDKDGYIDFLAGHLKDTQLKDIELKDTELKDVELKDVEATDRGFFKAGADGDKDWNQGIILEVEFALCLSEPGLVKEEARMIAAARNKTQPAGRSAGCFFKNPDNGAPAGQLIEMAGLKGKQVGDARISELHANFIMNRKNASANDVVALMALVQEVVFEKFNVVLEPEVKMVGI